MIPETRVFRNKFGQEFLLQTDKDGVEQIVDTLVYKEISKEEITQEADDVKQQKQDRMSQWRASKARKKHEEYQTPDLEDHPVGEVKYEE